MESTTKITADNFLFNVISKNTNDANRKLRRFLQNGGNPNFKLIVNNGFKSILTYALCSGNFEATKILCEFGANPNLKHDDQYPVLVLLLCGRTRAVLDTYDNQFYDVICFNSTVVLSDRISCALCAHSKCTF